MDVEERENIFRCVLFPHGNWEDFSRAVQIIEQKLGIQFKKQLDDLDAYYWIFDFEGVEMNLHFHVMFGDVELFTYKNDVTNGEVLRELAEQIKSYL